MHKFFFLVNYIIIHSWITELQVVLVILWMNLQNKEIEIKSGAKSGSLKLKMNSIKNMYMFADNDLSTRC